jgi:hypothetical protein
MSLWHAEYSKPNDTPSLTNYSIFKGQVVPPVLQKSERKKKNVKE